VFSVGASARILADRARAANPRSDAQFLRAATETFGVRELAPALFSLRARPMLHAGVDRKKQKSAQKEKGFILGIFSRLYLQPMHPTFITRHRRFA